jgi:hypothetical protein
MKNAQLLLKGEKLPVKITNTIKIKQILRHRIVYPDGTIKIVPAKKLIYGPKNILNRILTI